MSRPAKWSVVVLAMLMLQVLAVLSQTYVNENSKSASNADSSEFDYYVEHTHPLESLISIESTSGERGSYEISVTSELEAQISLEVISPDILDLPFGRSTQFSLEPGGEYSFSLTKYPINGDIDVTIVANAVTTEGYRFREQHTILSEPASDDECPGHLTPAEAVARGCTEAKAPTSSLLESYSWEVQRAFSRVSDMSLYDEEQLSGTTDWVVVTEMSLEAHAYSSAGPDHSEPTLLLKGSYIWSFDEPSLALDSLERAVKTGEIEIFYPLVELQEQLLFTPNDTLFPDQWHLDNTAQHGGTAVAGEDVNITSVWDDYNGSGVVISIVDDAIETGHPDLSTNWNAAVSYDWCDDDIDPNPELAGPFQRHGTAVAGVAAATGHNSLDVTGAAFGATLSGQRAISCGALNDSTLSQILNHYNDIIDIYSHSWVFVPPLYPSVGPLTAAALSLVDDAQNGRGGLGNIMVHGAGNGLLDGLNANYKDLQNSRYTIAVSAITDSGEQAWYSEPGTNILVTAHSGGGQAGITTTDRTGSDGYNSAGDTHDNFGGTSSATPLVSGIIALMLEANEDLTWRDVQHILVNSARKNDATDSSWVVNGAGHDVSEKYGFGAIDAGAAVDKALVWTTVGTEVTSSYGPFSPASAIADPTSLCQAYTTSSSTDSDSDGYKDEECTFTLPAGETLELVLTPPDRYASDVGVKLTDPSGTQAIWPPGTFSDSGNYYADNNGGFGYILQLDSYTMAGDYTLQIYDYMGNGCDGHATNYPIPCYVSASYGSDWTESTTTVSGGLNSIESIELTVDITHTYRSNLEIVLVSPSGTESWLARQYFDVDGDDHINWTFSSVHHWDESSDGIWTLKVRDMAAGYSGTLNSWTLNTYGTNNPLYVTGAFEYEDREFDEGGFTGVNPYLPIRGGGCGDLR